MLETAEMGPGGMIPYGSPIEARHIEHYRGPDPAAWLTSLARALLQAAITAEGLQFLVPEVTDLIRTRDGGVDAFLMIELLLPRRRTAGLVNPGKTTYQFKWRSDPADIVQAAKGELKKLKDGTGLPDYYVFITNIDLTIPQHRQIKRALWEGCSKFALSRIVVIGAGELKDRVNNDPRIRVTYFNVGLGICTLELAKRFAEQRYGNPAAPLFDRTRELSSLHQFLIEPDKRVMVMYGPQGVGKTRMVVEALSTVPDRVVWARAAPPLPAGLIQVLDESPYPPILVVDDVEDGADILIRRALEATQLRTILLCPWRFLAPGVVELAMTPLSQSDAETFLGQMFPDLPLSQRTWLYDQFGGFPGLLLQGAVALQASIGRNPLGVPLYEAMLHAYEEQATRGLGPATAALEALSVLPRFPLYADSAPDLEVVCRALGIDMSHVLRNLERVRARHLIERAEFRDSGFSRVTPPLLGRRIARRVIQGMADQLPTLYAQLSHRGRASLVRRLAELQDEPSFRPFLMWLLSTRGLFADLESVAGGASCIRALAETIPIPTAQGLRRVLEGASLEVRRSRLMGEDRQELIRALDALLHQRDTFDDGVKGMLCLAEADNTGSEDNAGRVFREVFHWKHIDIPRDAGLRARLLASLASDGSPQKRQIVAQAAAFCLRPSFSVVVWQGEGMAPPEAGWRASTWGEVHDSIRQVIEVLKRLAVDMDQEVKTEAIRGLAGGTRGILEVGLIEEAIAALEFVTVHPLEGSQRATLIEGVVGLVQNLHRMVTTAESDEWRASIEGAIGRGEALFRRLTSADFHARFLHWTGPSPMRVHRRRGEDIDTAEIAAEGRRLAEEIITQPALFSVELQDWVTDTHAQHVGYFLIRLGELGAGKYWLKAFEQRLARPRGVAAIATYVVGWSTVAPAGAEAYLDEIASKGMRWSEVAVEATRLLGGSARGAARLLRCVKDGGVSPSKVVSMLAFRGWHSRFTRSEFLDLLAQLRNGTAEVDWALLKVFWSWWLDKSEDREQLSPVVTSLLYDTAGDPPAGHESHEWDLLAAAVAEWDAEIGFKLLFAHYRKGDEGHRIFFPYDRERLVQTLASQDRPRLIRTFLEAALTGPEKRRVVMDLPDILRPEIDMPVLLQFIEQHGLGAARLTAKYLDAAQQTFWEVMPGFIVQWDDDTQVREGLLHSMTWVHDLSRDRRTAIEARRESLERLFAHPDPVVRDVARQAREALLREIQHES